MPAIPDDIKLLIDSHIRANMPATDFFDALSLIVDAIIRRSAGPAAMPPSVVIGSLRYLQWQIDVNLIRSSNQQQQLAYAEAADTAYQYLVNDPTVMGPLSDRRVLSTRNTLTIIIVLYQIQTTLLAASGAGPANIPPIGLDAPNERLREFVNAAVGPWVPWVDDRTIGIDGTTGGGGLYQTDAGLVVNTMAYLDDFQGRDPRIALGYRPLPAPATRTTRYSTLTWNLQGSSASTEAKWTTAATLFARGRDIILLQEAGSPPGAAGAPIRRITVRDQFETEWTVEQYQWNTGTTSRPNYINIYFLNVGRLRVNLAILHRAAAPFTVREVRVVADGIGGEIRPALGIQVTDTQHNQTSDVTFYTFHAISGGGPNAARMLRMIAQNTNTPYAVLGDFNRDPRPAPAGTGNWVVPASIGQIQQAAGPTQPATAPVRMLDYAVTNGTSGVPPDSGALGPGNVPSDHLYVMYDLGFPSL